MPVKRATDERVVFISNYVTASILRTPDGQRHAMFCLQSLVDENEMLEERLREIEETVTEQANDDALWSIYPHGQQPVAEAYLQQELRRLHAVVEGWIPVETEE